MGGSLRARARQNPLPAAREEQRQTEPRRIRSPSPDAAPGVRVQPGDRQRSSERAVFAATAQRQQDAHLHEIGRAIEAQPCPPVARLGQRLPGGAAHRAGARRRPRRNPRRFSHAACAELRDTQARQRQELRTAWETRNAERRTALLPFCRPRGDPPRRSRLSAGIDPPPLRRRSFRRTRKRRAEAGILKGAQMQIVRTGLKPLAFGHPAISPPSCDPSQHPKEGCSFGFTSGAVRRCAGRCAVDAPKKAHLWAQRSGQEAALFEDLAGRPSPRPRWQAA